MVETKSNFDSPSDGEDRKGEDIKRFPPFKKEETKKSIFFLDSGAFTLYANHLKGKRTSRYEFFDKEEFWKYVDEYALFVKSNIEYIEHYANVDVIHNPQKTWEVQKYLENKHGLNPVPVVHVGSDISWVQKYINTGYSYIGIGGAAKRNTKNAYMDWADHLFNFSCPPPYYTPIIKTHGFAITSFQHMIRYPWWSVDSTSWTKYAAFGWVCIPHKRGGEFLCDLENLPYVISFSRDSSFRNGHYYSVPTKAKEVLHSWLEKIDIPLGKMGTDQKIIEEGVLNHYGTRAAANILFFEFLQKSLPAYPGKFEKQIKKGLIF